eukprot:TRINITY_DN61668_c0_g1_i1.p1 TRINITY_DN61668_c0_g1~~TRINITY_DN61668_c0_g1_i1.p1  ORF type:complete len:851 (+),score=78.41 TRINITY_DN61668_c0_g1_i1:76-2628(+)
MGDKTKQPEHELITKFLSGTFSPTDYLRKTLKLSNYDTEREKINTGLKCVEEKLHSEVSDHHEELMNQVTSLREIDQKLDTVKTNVSTLQSSVKRMKHTIQEPYDIIQSRVTQLQNMWYTMELFHTVHNFLLLLQKLKDQQNLLPAETGSDKSSTTTKQPQTSGTLAMELPKAAKHLHEIETVLAEVDLTGIEIVDQERPFINAISKAIRKKANDVLQTGLQDQNQAEVGLALQTFYNLECLPEVVKDLVSKQRKSCQIYIHNQLKGVTDESGPKSSEQTVRSMVFTRLTDVTDHIVKHFMQLAQLYKVLAKRRDPVNHISFLTVATPTVGADFLPNFWQEITNLLHSKLNTMVQRSKMINEILVSEYPRMHRLFYTFIQGCVDHFYWLQPPDPKPTPDPNQWLKNTMQQFEKHFQEASLNRLLERVEKLGDKMRQGEPVTEDRGKEVPTEKEKSQMQTLQPADLRQLVASISQELTATRGEKALSPVVLTNIGTALQLFCAKCKKSVVAKWTCAAQIATPCNKAQTHNAAIYNNLCKLSTDVIQLIGSQPHITSGSHPSMMATSVEVEGWEAAYKKAMWSLHETLLEAVAFASSIISPIFTTTTKYSEKLLMKVHKEQYNTESGLQSKSAYIAELENRLQTTKNKILFTLDATTQPYEALSKKLAGHLLSFWVRHACLVPVPSENGKLKLAGELVNVHFAINTIYNVEKLGPPYRELRAFRTVMFMDTQQIAACNEVKNATLHPVNVVHHLISRSTALQFPYQQANPPQTVEEFSEELDPLFAEQTENQSKQTNDGAVLQQKSFDMFSDWWNTVEEMIDAFDQSELNDGDKEIVAALHTLGDMFWPIED